ncbi:MAG: alpha-hydroxy acid oxidase [Thermostichus sp. BF3_bins_97]
MDVEPLNLLEYETAALTCLSPMARDYYQSGAWDETTLRDNRAAFARYVLRPRVLVDVSQRDLSTEILGQKLGSPLLVAPTAFQGLAHPEGELATARAAAKAGVGMVLSTMATQSLESVAAAGSCSALAPLPHRSPQWFQLYVHRDRGLTRSLVERAEQAGFQALCLTVDAPVLGRRERDMRNRFQLPAGMTLANLASNADLGIPSVRASAPLAHGSESSLFTYFIHQIDPTLSWKDLEWLAGCTPLPIVVKGILRGDDALRCLEHGAKGIIVSNHGGRQLDGAIASLDALPDVVEQVGKAATVLIDGGIRRGTDVLKALALGAKGVLLGRPILWGLAVAGEAGVLRVLQLLQDELSVAMALCGCAHLSEVDPSLIKAV